MNKYFVILVVNGKIAGVYTDIYDANKSYENAPEDCQKILIVGNSVWTKAENKIHGMRQNIDNPELLDNILGNLFDLL